MGKSHEGFVGLRPDLQIETFLGTSEMKSIKMIISVLLVLVMTGLCQADQDMKQQRNQANSNENELRQTLMKLNDNNKTVKLAAIKRLGEIGDPAAVDSLINLLIDKDKAVRESAMAALADIGRETDIEGTKFYKAMEQGDFLAPGRLVAALAFFQLPLPRVVSLTGTAWQEMAGHSIFYLLPLITVSLFFFSLSRIRIVTLQCLEFLRLAISDNTKTQISESVIVVLICVLAILVVLFFCVGLIGLSYGINIILLSLDYCQKNYVVEVISNVHDYYQLIILNVYQKIIFHVHDYYQKILTYCLKIIGHVKYLILPSITFTLMVFFALWLKHCFTRCRTYPTKITIFLLVLAGFTLTFLVQPFVASINYLLELPGTTLPIVSILLGTLALYSWLFLFFTPTVAVVTSPLTLFAGSWRRAKRAAAGAICPSCAVRRFDYEKKELPLAVRLSSRWLAREVPEKHKDFLDYFRCGRCKGREKMTGVRTLVGVIGNGPDKPEKRGSEAVVSLWDNRNEKSRYADIDRLEIRESDGVRYDMAINSVILTLHDRSGKPSGYLRKIPVRIIGNPPIPVGSMNILEQKFGKITRG